MEKITVVLCIIALLLAASCSGSKDNKDIDLNEVMERISSSIVLPSDDMMRLNSVDKLTDYYGIAADDVDSFAVQMNSSGVQQDEIAIIKAVDSKAAERVKEALQKRLDSKANQMKNYLPEQYEIIQKCSVQTKGYYVTLFISENANQMTQIFNSYF